MKKKIFIAVIVVIGLAAIPYMALKNMPIMFGSSASVIHYSMDDMIKGSELIVIGEVKINLPSQWKDANGKGSRRASPADIARAHGLFTDSIISVTQTLKGDNVKPNVRVRNFSGEIENIRWIGESEPSLIIGKTYLFFLRKDIGATAKVDPGDYLSVGAYQGVYEIVDGKAISKTDSRNLDELIAYIQNKLSETPTPTTAPVEATSTETSLPVSTSTEIAVTETLQPTETPLPASAP